MEQLIVFEGNEFRIRPRPEFVEREVEGISAFVALSGLREICLACHAGTLEDKIPGDTCCTGCPLHTGVGCASKPVSCALYICRYARKKLPHVAEALDRYGARLRQLGYPTWTNSYEAALRCRELEGAMQASHGEG